MVARLAHLWHVMGQIFGLLTGPGFWTIVVAPGERTPKPLRDLDPAWLPDPPQPGGRRFAGLYFHCPAKGDHRVSLFFLKPLDDGPPMAPPGVPLYFVENVDPEDLEPETFPKPLEPVPSPWDVITVSPPDDSAPIECPTCGGKFYLLGGAVITSSR